MATILENLIDQMVSVVTCDGRLFMGKLKGFDQSTNIIICNAIERIFSEDSPAKDIQLGLSMIRGDNIGSSLPSVPVHLFNVIIGEIDTEVDDSIKLQSLRAAPLRPITTHGCFQ